VRVKILYQPEKCAGYRAIPRASQAVEQLNYVTAERAEPLPLWVQRLTWAASKLRPLMARSENSCSTMKGASELDELAPDSYARSCAQLLARRRSMTAHYANGRFAPTAAVPSEERHPM